MCSLAKILLLSTRIKLDFIDTFCHRIYPWTKNGTGARDGFVDGLCVGMTCVQKYYRFSRNAQSKHFMVKTTHSSCSVIRWIFQNIRKVCRVRNCTLFVTFWNDLAFTQQLNGMILIKLLLCLLSNAFKFPTKVHTFCHKRFWPSHT